MKKILVLCTGNSCRSQMAEGYIRHFGNEHLEVFSAGIEIHGVNPRAVEIMKEDGVDISYHTSNHINEYAHIQFDYVITVCDHASEQCPVFPGKVKRIHMNFPDPAKAEGSNEEITVAFRSVRDQIKKFAYQFLKNENLIAASKI